MSRSRRELAHGSQGLRGTTEKCALLSGNFCPLCDKCYDDDDYESKMMQCGKCDRWVHSKCENLSGTEGWSLFITVSFLLGTFIAPRVTCKRKIMAVLLLEVF